MAHALLAAVLLVGAQAASADGRYYASDYKPEISDQRALIAFNGERQVMLIENRIALPDGRPTAALGWVVPVPAVPEIAFADLAADRFFYRTLRRHTDPTGWSVIPLVWIFMAFGFLLYNSLRQTNQPDWKSLRVAVWTAFVWTILSSVSLSSPTPAGKGSGVEIVKTIQAGPMEAKVVRASTGTELVDWLRENGFAYGDRDVAVVEDYLRAKWVFVVTRFVPQPGAEFKGASASPALVLGFPSKSAVYPVSLTAAGDQPLDLVLYVFAKGRMESSAGMHVSFAGPVGMPELRSKENKPAASLFWGFNTTTYLTKFTRKLAPDEMRADIRFSRVEGKGDHRDWTVGGFFIFWAGGAVLVGVLAHLIQIAARGRFLISGPAWCSISMLVSPLLGMLFMLGTALARWDESRKSAAPDA